MDFLESVGTEKQEEILHSPESMPQGAWSQTHWAGPSHHPTNQMRRRRKTRHCVLQVSGTIRSQLDLAHACLFSARLVDPSRDRAGASRPGVLRSGPRCVAWIVLSGEVMKDEIVIALHYSMRCFHRALPSLFSFH